jgi:hypothetical protein
MSKLMDEQVRKTEVLVSGLSRNRCVLESLDVNERELGELETDSRALDTDNRELERMKAEVQAKSREANRKLKALREKFMYVKNKVKRKTLPENWKELGIMDKK